MSNIFEEYLELTTSSDTLDVLNTFAKFFEKKNISLFEYENYFDSYDSETVYDSIKLIILLEAQKVGVIPDSIDIEDCFVLHDGVYDIISANCPNAEQIQADFKEWSGIELDIV